MDGPAAAALRAGPPPTARARAGRHDRVLVRPAFDMALRVRRRQLRSRAHQWVQSARWSGLGARLTLDARGLLDAWRIGLAWERNWFAQRGDD
jgi:hypothetical protein